jgi:hypothetical protein
MTITATYSRVESRHRDFGYRAAIEEIYSSDEGFAAYETRVNLDVEAVEDDDLLWVTADGSPALLDRLLFTRELTAHAVEVLTSYAPGGVLLPGEAEARGRTIAAVRASGPLAARAIAEGWETYSWAPVHGGSRPHWSYCHGDVIDVTRPRADGGGWAVAVVLASDREGSSHEPRFKYGEETPYEDSSPLRSLVTVAYVPRSDLYSIVQVAVDVRVALRVTKRPGSGAIDVGGCAFAVDVDHRSRLAVPLLPESVRASILARGEDLDVVAGGFSVLVEIVAVGLPCVDPSPGDLVVRTRSAVAGSLDRVAAVEGANVTLESGRITWAPKDGGYTLYRVVLPFDLPHQT